MTLQLEPAELALARRRIGALHDDLVSEQAVLSRQVEQLLDSSWSGGAATQFRTAWAQWCRGMRDVLLGVGLEGDAIALTRAELMRIDVERAAVTRRLQERLGQA
jgi:WXG100 family type VII secretion target